MREFTKEEKELIIHTRITEDCFDELPKSDCEEPKYINHRPLFETLIHILEKIRVHYLYYRDERYFQELVTMLPNSYKVVKL